MKYVADEGFDLELLKTGHNHRQRLNCRFFKTVAEKYVRRPFSDQPASAMPVKTREGEDEYRFGEFKMIFAVTTDAGCADVLADEQIRSRLWTYFDFRDGQCRSIDLRDYIRTGRLMTRKKWAEQAVPSLFDRVANP